MVARQPAGRDSGTCRDFTALFVDAARLPRFALHSVALYLYDPASDTDASAG